MKRLKKKTRVQAKLCELADSEEGGEKGKKSTKSGVAFQKAALKEKLLPGKGRKWGLNVKPQPFDQIPPGGGVRTSHKHMARGERLPQATKRFKKNRTTG